MAKIIPLTQGKFAIIDDEDFELVSQYKWCVKNNGRFYALTDAKGERILMHRLILGLSRDDKRDVDHANCNSLDNRRCNIRVCTRSQNNGNSRKRKNTTSKHKGVCFFKRDKKWKAEISFNGERTHLGYFDLEIDAAKAYNKAALERFGEFARLNNVKRKQVVA